MCRFYIRFWKDHPLYNAVCDYNIPADVGLCFEKWIVCLHGYLSCGLQLNFHVHNCQVDVWKWNSAYYDIITSCCTYFMIFLRLHFRLHCEYGAQLQAPDVRQSMKWLCRWTHTTGNRLTVFFEVGPVVAGWCINTLESEILLDMWVVILSQKCHHQGIPTTTKSHHFEHRMVIVFTVFCNHLWCHSNK